MTFITEGYFSVLIFITLHEMNETFSYMLTNNLLISLIFQVLYFLTILHIALREAELLVGLIHFYN